MATKTIVETVCDVTHRTKDQPPARTVEVRIDGQKVKRDLCTEHETQLRQLLGIGRGAKRNGTAKAAATNGHRTRPRRNPFGAQIRAWAAENGYADLPARGRLPGHVVEAWEHATGETVPAS